MKRTDDTPGRIRALSSGLVLERDAGPHGQATQEKLPLFSGSVHYFRMPRAAWRPTLEGLLRLGVRIVDTYVPWGVHETGPGAFDFGERDPRLDVVGFLEIAAELGLRAIVRPGPHINAELTFFGIPERVIWDERCQARSAAGERVILPIPPLAFPVPSYASRAFQGEARLWLRAAAEQLSPLVWPEGPIVLLQVDNEGALYFRDGPYDQDYHPDAVDQYRRFLRRKYPTAGALGRAYGDPTLDFGSVEPPRCCDATNPDGLARHLDWAECQEALLEAALYQFRAVLDRHGLGAAPKMHNLPIAERSTPLDPARVERTVDFISLDYYHHASAKLRREIAFRTSHLAARSTLRSVPAFAAEMGVGFPPYFPPILEADSAFVSLTALAYGLRGLNLYMAVQRDRWIGGPVDARGELRPSSDFWVRLFAAMDRTRFSELARRVRTFLVVPRSFDRLARVCHAFGPLPPTAFAFGGEAASRGGLEGDLDPTTGAVVETERFLHDAARLLDEERIPFAVVGADLLERVLDEARFTLVVCPGSLDPSMTEILARRIALGAHVGVGPRAPERDAAMRPCRERIPAMGPGNVPVLLPGDPDLLRGIVRATASSLGIERLAAVPECVHTTLHHDADGRPRVLFVINSSPAEVQAVVQAPGAGEARDALSGEVLAVKGEHVALPIPPLSVRMLELSTA